MKRRTPRGLDPEETELWQRVAKTATPLNNPGRTNLAPTEQVFTPPRDPTTPKPVPRFEIGERSQTALPAHDLSLPIRDQIAGQRIDMDKKAFKRLKRGQSRPEGRLDLHGMTADVAHAELISFILASHAKGKRLVLVITGKGRTSTQSGPIPTRTGVLKHQTPIWLANPPLSPLVLQVTEAHQRHGGSGAFYVYLRRH